ncbi:MFS transporter [Ruminococcaceae bacterium OttesenSCG-928-A11]|nr:MFS transporter [Ruminococcaceae bacterium OttesenSCG-928-A11]
MIFDKPRRLAKRKLNDKRGIRLFFFVNWFSCLSIYFGRYNLSACVNDMSLNHGFGKPELGGVVASFYLAYGAGQLLSGLLGDKIPAKWLVFAGLASSAAVNLAFALQNAVWPMSLLWLANGFAQALVWVPMVRLCSDRLTMAQCRKTCVDLYTTGPLGMLATYLLCAFLLHFFSWRACFFAGFLATAAGACLWLAGITGIERHADKNGVVEAPAPGLPASEGPGKPLPAVLASGLLLAAAAAALNGMLKDGMTTWAPTFLSEKFSLDASVSTGLATLLPIVNLAGVYLAKYCNERVFANELKTSAAFYGVTLVAVLGIVWAGGRNVLLLLGLLAASTSAMVGVNTLLVGLLPLHFYRSNRVSAATGLLNSATYVGGAIASYLFAFTAERFGWSVNYAVWLALAAAGGMLCAQGARQWGRFAHG